MTLQDPWPLIQKYLSGRATFAERQEVQRWYRESPENQRLFEEIKQIWEASPEPEYQVDVEEAWQRFEDGEYSQVSDQKDEKDRTLPKVNPTKSGKRDFAYRMVAAMLFLMALGGLSFYIMYSDIGEPASVEQPVMAMKHLETGPGERAGVTFSDGTKIILNADSKLEFPKEFEANRREVYLDGEAYFEVAENKDRPFVIKTGRARVKVLGTELNVQAWQEDERVGVGVREGRVSVVSSDTATRDEPVILEKFQRAVLEKGDTEFAVHNLEKEKFLYWLKDGLYFHNTPLPHVIKRLERRFNVDIQIADPELSTYKYTGAFREAHLEETLKVISVSLDIVFKHQDDHILVQSKQG